MVFRFHRPFFIAIVFYTFINVLFKYYDYFRFCIIFSFNTQDLPENHFGELEPPVKILLINIIIVIIIIIVISLSEK